MLLELPSNVVEGSAFVTVVVSYQILVMVI